jgi:hypothetical protein
MSGYLCSYVLVRTASQNSDAGQEMGLVQVVQSVDVCRVIYLHVM